MSGLEVVAYISMAFGNPYGDLWSVEEVAEAVGILADMDITRYRLPIRSDWPMPQQVGELITRVASAYDHLEIGVHLHSRARAQRRRLSQRMMRVPAFRFRHRRPRRLPVRAG